jgi:hypothetical protein
MTAVNVPSSVAAVTVALSRRCSMLFSFQGAAS